MTFGRNYNSKDSRIEFVCFSFRAGLLVINGSSFSFKADTENNANFNE